MESRRAILERVRSTPLPAVDLPRLDQGWVQYEDPVKQFETVLASVGGQFVTLNDLNQLEPWLHETEMFQRATRVCSQVPGLNIGNVDLGLTNDPHTLNDLDLFIGIGEIAVAENGAIWISDRDLAQRVVLFIARHAVLIVQRAALVQNMHEAYAQLHFRERGFGVFISGPSKTADIEQSLVIGAHGPKSLHVVMIEPLASSIQRGSGTPNG